jgi:hypothetical protein
MQLILLLFLNHLSHGRDLGFHARLGLAQVVPLTVAQVIFPVGIVFIVVAITLVVDFILFMYRDSSGENRGYLAEKRS